MGTSHKKATASDDHDEFDHDVFISYRHSQTLDEVRDLAEYLIIGNNGLKVFWDEGGRSHLHGAVSEETVARMRRSRVVIVVMSGEGVTSDTSDPSGQEVEVKALIKDKQITKNNKNKRSTFIPVFILREDEDSPGNWATADEIMELCPLAERLSKNRQYFQYNAGETDEWPVKFHSDMRRGCESFFEENSVPTIVERDTMKLAAQNEAKSSPKNKKKSKADQAISDTSNIAILPWEQNYITDNLLTWQRGLTSSRTADDYDAGSILGYRLSTFVEPFANLLGQSRNRTDPREARPVFDWLLNNDNDFIFVTGPAGIGKSTLLCQSAAAFSSTLSDRLRSDVVGLTKNSEWLTDRAQETSDIALGRVPIVVDARDLSDIIGPSSTQKAVDKMLDWLAGPEVLNTSQGGQALYARFLERPYVLIIDGLNGASSAERGQTIVAAAQVLRTRIDHNGGNLKIITSGRMNERYDDGNIRRLELFAFSPEQIDLFTQRFVVTSLSSNRDRLQRRIVSQFDRTDNMIELFGTPLFLSAACQLISDGGALKRHRSKVEFCEAMINHLVRPRRSLDPLEEGVGTGGPIPYEARLKFLESLSFDSIKMDAPANQKTFERSILVALGEEFPEDHFLRNKAISPKEILEELIVNTEILTMTASSRRPRFTHNLFREYLAARHLASKIVDSPDTILSFIEVDRSDRWEPVIGLIPDIIDTILKRPDAGYRLIEPLLSKVEEELESQSISSAKQYAALLFGALGADGADSESFDPADIEELVIRTGDVLRSLSPHFDLLDRLDHHSELARFYASAEHADDAYPALISHLSKSTDDDLNARDVEDMPDSGPLGRVISVSPMPVLVAHYRAFLEDVSRDTQQWSKYWTATGGEASKAIDEVHTPAKSALLSPSARWGAQLQLPSAPVTFVTFYEAVAFCNWLTDQARENGTLGPQDFYRLPTLDEWQAIAGYGTDSTPTYSWGNEWDTSKSLIFPEEESRSLSAAWPATFFPGCTALNLYSFGTNITNWLTEVEWGWPAKPKGRGSHVIGGSWLDISKPDFEIADSLSIRKQNFKKRWTRTGFRTVIARAT